MKVEIQVVSRDVISPSSPTPKDLKNYKFSYLDQLVNPALMPHLIFYQADDSLSNSEKSSRLKKSLSETLNLYYPLAGRLVKNMGVNCSDQGVTYVEAQANCTLVDVVNEPIPDEFSKFLACNPDEGGDRCLVIQTTFFTCGGLVIALGVSHQLADAWSILMFLKCWTATTRGDDAHILPPRFDSAKLFPPKDLAGCYVWDNQTKKEEITLDDQIKKEEITCKRFLFPAKKIHELQDKYTKHQSQKEDLVRPTRVQALGAFIWTRFYVSTKKKDDPTKTCTLILSVSIRKRAIPTLPDDLFGNLLVALITLPSPRYVEEASYGIVETLREAIDSINGDYVSKLQNGSDHSVIVNDEAKKVLATANVVPFGFYSLCRFPLYEADFGWGKPVWVAPASNGYSNFVIFMDTYSGGGVEAWVNLTREHMSKFEADEEVLAYLAN